MVPFYINCTHYIPPSSAAVRDDGCRRWNEHGAYLIRSDAMPCGPCAALYEASQKPKSI